MTESVASFGENVGQAVGQPEPITVTEIKSGRGAVRALMPETAEFLDVLRAEFGTDEINAQIKLGMAGHANCFYAIEAGRSIGTAFDPVDPDREVVPSVESVVPSVVRTRGHRS
jgi:hypothetical protein